jgi:hypothetical protein
MSIAESDFEKIMGLASFTEQQKKYFVHKEFAGDPTNNVTPDFVGQQCHDTTNDDWYIAHSLAVDGWKIFAT